MTGDGALGVWAALRDVFPGTREQRCWVHKTANVLDALPKRLQPRAKTLLHEMAEAPSRADARKALERVPRRVRREVPEGRREARQGLGRADRVLRLPRRALAAPAHHEPDREQLRDREAPHQGHQGRRLQEGRARDGLQAPGRRPASAGGASTATNSSPTCSTARSSRTESRSPTTKPRQQTRRSPPDHFTSSSTTFDNCSPRSGLLGSWIALAGSVVAKPAARAPCSISCSEALILGGQRAENVRTGEPAAQPVIA